jgi:acetate kinase
VDIILTINGGSSSLRFALFRAGAALARIFEGKFERLGMPDSRVEAADLETQQKEERHFSGLSHQDCLPVLVELLEKKVPVDSLGAIGHRVVHGGSRYFDPQRVDAAMLEELQLMRPFDPEHLPLEIFLIRKLSARFPEIPQVACFDTGFHHDLPTVARLLPIPRLYETKGIRRYGFHGLSFTFLMRELERVAGRAAARGRVILAHLGNGCSLAAVHEGRPVDTTMAFTPAAGLVMGTRSGDLDPGLVDYLARTDGLTIRQFHEMVNLKSGLLGVSETSSDVRDLLERESTDRRAAEALGVFCYQAKKWIGALAAGLGGLDTLVFCGGIGENSAAIRARICDGLGFLGIALDSARNAGNAGIISAETGPACVRVMRTDEEYVIAMSVSRVLWGDPPDRGSHQDTDTR